MTDEGGADIGVADDPKRQLVEERAQDLAVSLWYTYNQHFTVANGYRYLRLVIDVATASMGGVLTYALIWEGVPTPVMIALAVAIAVLTGIRSAIKPGKQETRFRQSANEYKYLFDGVRDFLKLDLQDPTVPPEELEDQYREYNDQRRELNRDNPDAASIWHKYVRWQVGEDGPDDIRVTEAEVAKVMGDD